MIAMLISSFIARSITLPIQKLRDSMERVQEGDFKAADDLVIPSQNEIGSLTTSFNVMTHKIEDLMAQNVHEQELKRKSELKALQSQINPHFLYNTLDSVVWMTENGRTEDAVVMLTSLARFFRISLSRGSSVIPIADELEHARHYLTIQKMRYKNKFSADIQAEDGVEQLYTIKLVIQPVLELSLIHI